MRILLLCLLLIAPSAFAAVIFPPDTRSWEQVTAHFMAGEGGNANDGEYDGRRLKELDARKAASFLISLLAEDQPYRQRVRAIGALGWPSFHEAIPALSAIALDSTDNEEIRAQALNPGLRYMKHPDAVKVAIALAADKSVRIRSSAYWVLSSHGTDDAVEVLTARLRADDTPHIAQLINALRFSKHPRAGKIVFEQVDFSTLLKDEESLLAYSSTMAEYRIPEAQQNLLALTERPGRTLSSYMALRYFGSFPRDDVAPALIAYIEATKSVSYLYDTVTEFIKSPNISDNIKSKLSAFIASGKVKKREGLFRR